MLFPTPDFIHDENSVQYLFFAKFVRMLKKDFIALSPTAFDTMLNLVSDSCEVYYQHERSSKTIEQLSRDMQNSDKEEIEVLKAQLQSRVA
jgi:hypothetical protein